MAHAITDYVDARHFLHFYYIPFCEIDIFQASPSPLPPYFLDFATYFRFVYHRSIDAICIFIHAIISLLLLCYHYITDTAKLQYPRAARLHRRSSLHARYCSAISHRSYFDMMIICLYMPRTCRLPTLPARLFLLHLSDKNSDDAHQFGDAILHFCDFLTFAAPFR